MVTIDTLINAVVAVFALGKPLEGSRPAASKVLSDMVKAVRMIRRNRRTRVHLADLTDDQLRDIGISRAEADREIGKSAFLAYERQYDRAQQPWPPRTQ